MKISGELLTEEDDWVYIEDPEEKDQGEISDEFLQILKDLDIRDRKRESLKEKAKAGLRKKSAKNKTKNDKLLEVAATIPKITNFFTRKQKPPTTTPSSSNPLVVPMEWDCLDGMAEDMEWDEYPALPWSVVHQMEETRHRTCRRKRAAFQRKLTLKNLEMKKLEKESLKQFMRDLIMDRWEGERVSTLSSKMLSGLGVEATLSAGPDIVAMSRKSEGSWVTKGHTITWSMTVSVESNLEILTTNRTTHRQEMADWLVEMAVKEARQMEELANRTTHRQEMADWLVEMAVKEATQREELTKKLEELMLANEGGDDVTMLDYGVEQQGRVQQGEDDTTMSWEEVLGTSDQVQKPRKRIRRTPRVRQVSVREVKCSESEYYTAHGQYKARPVARSQLYNELHSAPQGHTCPDSTRRSLKL